MLFDLSQCSTIYTRSPHALQLCSFVISFDLSQEQKWLLSKSGCKMKNISANMPMFEKKQKIVAPYCSQFFSFSYVANTSIFSNWQTSCAFTVIYYRYDGGGAVASVAASRRKRRLTRTRGGITTSRGNFMCSTCCKTYKWYRGLLRHLKYECGKAPRFKCPHCSYAGKHRSHVYSHIKSHHRNQEIYTIDIQQGWSKTWHARCTCCYDSERVKMGICSVKLE